MSRGSLCFVIIFTSLLCIAMRGQEEQKPIVPNALRVQPTKAGLEGRWIPVAGYAYVGSPTFSRDGEWIAFDAYKAGSNDGECWLTRIDGTEMHKLTGGATPRWSPDGKRLIFMRENQDDPSRDQGIFVINHDGTGERRICDGRWPDWSPDGNRIAFSLGGRRGRFAGARVMVRVCVANADGSDRQEIADGDCPTWSPDGNRIVCCWQDPAYPAPMLRVVDLENDTQTLLGYGWFRANWGPDGKSVTAFGPLRSNRVGMIKLPTQPPIRPELLLPEHQGLSPSFSPDGQTIVFVGENPSPGSQ
jgi:dipeptidyl aminopeptidase/acylaminoacyl peptidase